MENSLTPLQYASAGDSPPTTLLYFRKIKKESFILFLGGETSVDSNGIGIRSNTSDLFLGDLNGFDPTPIPLSHHSNDISFACGVRLDFETVGIIGGTDSVRTINSGFNTLNVRTRQWSPLRSNY